MSYNKERYRKLKAMAYYFLFGLWYLFSLLPMRVHYILSDAIFCLLYYIIRYRRRVVRKNLTESFPEKPLEEVVKIERGFYHWFCDYFVESVKYISISEKAMKKRFVFKNPELVEETIKSGQSVGFYMGHYCNWEWVSSLPLWIKSGAQVGHIYHPLENQVFDRLFLYLRQHMGCVSIPMQETLRKMLEFKQAGQPIIIGYLSDQKPHWVNIHHWVDFLNHDTPVLTGTERVLRKMNHAVYYLDIWRPRRGYYEAEFKLITREPQQTKDFEITDAYYQQLEQTIRRAPEYWLWSHNRWSRTREEFNERFMVVNGRVVPKS